MSLKIDSNLTGLAIAEEESLKTLPVTPVWYTQEPNSYSDLGAEITTVARQPIDPSRQNKKGTTTDLDASGGFNTDHTQNNMTRLLQGFFFADAHEKASTVPLNATKVTITAVDDTTGYAAASGLSVFAINDLVLASGFTTPANNGLKVVTAASGTAVAATGGGLVDEGSPPAAARLLQVGAKFASADVAAAYSGGVFTLTSAASAFGSLDVSPGEWVFIGGDAAGTYLTNNRGYARVLTKTNAVITFDETSFTPVTQAGTGVTLYVFCGTFLRNEKTPSLIVRRTYQLERTLGSDDDGVQAEYLTGAVANEFALNFAQADKLMADLSYVACDQEFVDGIDGVKSGTRVDALGEDAFNTTSDVYRLKLYIHSASNPNPDALFAYVTEGSLSINNNVQPAKAIGVMGAFDTTAGNFDVTGSVTAYFTTVEACRAVRENADVGFNGIFAKENAGYVYDIPLLALGGGRLNVEKDAPIMVPLDSNGAECAQGYTLSYTNFGYLPEAAMPVTS